MAILLIRVPLRVRQYGYGKLQTCISESVRNDLVEFTCGMSPLGYVGMEMGAGQMIPRPFGEMTTSGDPYPFGGSPTHFDSSSQVSSSDPFG